jgi:hypothetical protein
VASSGDAAFVEPASKAIYQAAKSMGFDPGLLGEAVRERSAEASADDDGLWIVEAAGVHEDWLSRLEPPAGRPPELLLWLHTDSKAWLRESYLFGMLRWSLAPAKSVALVDGAAAEQLAMLKDCNGDEAEVLSLSFSWDAASASRTLMQQLLQSAMARASHRRRRSFRLGRGARA